MMKEIKTKNLIIRALDDEQLSKYAEGEKDEAYKKDLEIRLKACLKLQSKRDWYTVWQISLLQTEDTIGIIAFKGRPIQGKAEIICEINEEYRNKGFAFEAVNSMIKWAFLQQEVYWISAEIDPNNLPAKRLLEKLDFISKEDDAGKLIYEIEKPVATNTAFYMIMYTIVGVIMGVFFSELGLGFCLGCSLGMIIGFLMDYQDWKKRLRFKMIPQNEDIKG